MKINRTIILRTFAEKIWKKHQVETEEICEVFNNIPYFHKLEKGNIRGENLYGAYGKTCGGRYLSVFFVHKLNMDALVISARDMDKKERKRYAKT